MKAEVKTIVDGCDRYCKEFDIEVTTLYANGSVYARVYKCSHLEQCKAMIQAIETVTVEMKNIT